MGDWGFRLNSTKRTDEHTFLPMRINVEADGAHHIKSNFNTAFISESPECTFAWPRWQFCATMYNQNCQSAHLQLASSGCP
jgi:hypothetical protein